MDRRDFIKSVLTCAAAIPFTRLAAEDLISGPAAAMTRRMPGAGPETLPLLGFGGMRLPRKGKSPTDIDVAEVEKMVARALQGGCNYFDTAYMYHGGQSESCLGAVLSKYPRSSYLLADKMPMGNVRRADDVPRIFKEQLERCRTDHFDFYLLHALNRRKWQTAKKCKVVEYLREMQKAGRIRHLGFSFHDSPEVLRQIVNEGRWEFAQIQLNYLDWEAYRSREQYEILTQAHIPVIVMEPLKGGMLAKLPEAAERILKAADPDASCAAWAFRYAGSLPNVVCILSGMSSMAVLEENLRTFSPLRPLSDAERRTLDQALTVLKHGESPIPCTSCRYCMPCPAGVDIPANLALLNAFRKDHDLRKFKRGYRALPEAARADECVNCGRCLKQCPQHIAIPKWMKEISSRMQ